MSTSVFYCKSWFRAEKKPTEIWTEERARAAHLSKKLYTAVIGTKENPYCFLEITNKFVGVGFLDASLRERLSYSFQEVEPNLMFLDMATYREFEPDGDAIVDATTFFLRGPGTSKSGKKNTIRHNLK